MWLIIHQWFDNDCLINHLAWLIIWQWLSHIDYSGVIKKLIKLIIHLSSQSSSINQSARLIFRVIDYSTMIHQCIVDYSRDILLDNDWLSHWIFIRVVNRVQSTNLHDWLFGWLVIQQWFDDECLISSRDWLYANDLVPLIIRDSSTNSSKLIIHSSSQSSPINQPAYDCSCDWLFNNDSTMTV